jgi:microcystin degradation protein MlrC
LRIAVGGIRHETNTFSPVWTDYADFVVRRGAAVLENSTGQLQAGQDVRLLPTFVASARPSGLVRKAAYTRLKAELLDELRAVLPLDGVYLDLHGAMEVEEIGDG